MFFCAECACVVHLWPLDIDRLPLFISPQTPTSLNLLRFWQRGRRSDLSEIPSRTNSLRSLEHCQFRLTNGPFAMAKREILSTILVIQSHFCPSVNSGLMISRINLSNASEADLQDLSDACQPATFGVNE